MAKRAAPSTCFLIDRSANCRSFSSAVISVQSRWTAVTPGVEPMRVSTSRLICALSGQPAVVRAMVIVTAPSATDLYDFVSRFFAPAVGVPEDPVTGSAHCALAPYWADRLGRQDLRGYQASARGGLYAQGSPADFQEPYLKHLFGFLGVTDIEFVRAEGVAHGPEQKAAALAQAHARIEQALPLAA